MLMPEADGDVQRQQQQGPLVLGVGVGMVQIDVEDDLVGGGNDIESEDDLVFPGLAVAMNDLSVVEEAEAQQDDDDEEDDDDYAPDEEDRRKTVDEWKAIFSKKFPLASAADIAAKIKLAKAEQEQRKKAKAVNKFKNLETVGIKGKSKHYGTWMPSSDVPTAPPPPAFTGRTGLQVSVDDIGKSGPNNTPAPCDIFNLFITDDMMTHTVTSTNAYVREKKRSPRPDQYYPHNSGKYPWPPNLLRDWKVLTKEELRAYYGILIGMSVAKLPKVEDYWSSRQLVGNPAIAKVMTRDRFKAITSCLHFSDPLIDAAGKKADPFWKVRPLLDAFMKRCIEVWWPQEWLSYDEMMAKYGGQFWQKFIEKSKPDDGYKLFGFCCSRTGYMLLAELALKVGEERNVDMTIEERLLRMARQLPNKHHRIAMDNLFTSVAMFKSLLALQVPGPMFAVGTTRGDRGAPPSLAKKNPLTKKFVVPARGDYVSKTNMEDHRITATCWHDSEPTIFLSSMHDPHKKCTILRRMQGKRGRQRVTANEPPRDYNDNMGGNDRTDALRKAFSTQRPSKKWWKPLFHWALDQALVNSLIVWNTSFAGNNKLSASLFREQMFAHLTGMHDDAPPLRQRAGKRKRQLKLGQIRLLPGMHLIKKLIRDGYLYDRRNCKWCYMNGKKTNKTPYGCDTCGIHLCANGCFYDYHTNAIEAAEEEMEKEAAEDEGEADDEVDEEMM